MKRIEEYRRNYFLWVEDFNLPTTNNFSEKGLEAMGLSSVSLSFAATTEALSTDVLSGVQGGCYSGARSLVVSIANPSQLLQVHSLSQSQIYTSWLRDDSPWRVSVKSFTEVDTGALDRARSSFIRLLDDEIETSGLFGMTRVNTVATSAAAQVVFILQTESLNSLIGISNINSLYGPNGHGGISELLSDYNDFVLNQHIEIQRVFEARWVKDVEWHVSLLDLERIKEFVCRGDKKKGDGKVEDEDFYQYVFRVKDIRSELRNDLKYGSKKEIAKKWARTNKEYLHYTNKRTRTAKEFKEFQIKIYEEDEALLQSLQTIEL